LSEQGRAAVRARPGSKILEVSAAEEMIWLDRTRPVVEEWVKGTPNGSAVLAAFREEIAKIRAKK
jgi:hypothetical protein